MRLADHFLAARGSLADLGGFVSYMEPAIREAQRFEIADEVGYAVHDLVHSKPSTLAAALPLCRLPYPVMWLEWRGGLGPHRNAKTIPTRQGVLIESLEGQVGWMTFAWIHPHGSDRDNDLLGIEHQVNISPIAVYFDWRPDGDVREIVRKTHKALLTTHCKDATTRACVDVYCEVIEKKYLSLPALDSVTAQMFFTQYRPDWTKHGDDRRELAAMAEMERHLAPGLSPHSVGLVTMTLTVSAQLDRPELAQKFAQGWEEDIQGEGTFVECFLAMLNSRNPVVEHTPADLTKLNRNRVRQRKLPFLPYNKTRLTMSRSQANIARARGVDRETARQHLVRGHFKIRKTGVYWWSPFLRGDARKGSVERREYDVVR
ncbi:MAG: hypothetical protein J2P55_00095 [Rhizobiales bacterium]|nr:hypothetical protein [Hyphomicrobiales bacterium]